MALHQTPRYFVPHHLTLAVACPAEIGRKTFKDTVLKAMPEHLKTFGALLEKAEIVHEHSAHVRLHLPNHPAHVLTLIKLKLPFNDDELVKRCVATHTHIKQQQGQPEAGKYASLGATLNWYMTGALDGYPLGSGGPGKRHVPTTMDDATFAQKSKFTTPSITGTGTGVDIYVLDSFPADYPNPLSADEKSALAAEFASFQALDDTNNPAEPRLAAYPEDDPATIPSHGVFIVKLIKAIAPDANVIAIPVLNERAIGSMGSFAIGLDVVREHITNSGNPYAISNLSVLFANPATSEVTADNQVAIDTSSASPDLAHASAIASDVHKLVISGGKAFALESDTSQREHLFIAAAGNERTGSSSQLPTPDYPAQDDAVWGVGALDRNGQPTSYSNMADLSTSGSSPTFPGYWTFGGDYETGSTTGDGGILGETLENGQMVRVFWAGTSFAAPIITALEACLIAEGNGRKLTDIATAFTNSGTNGTTQIGWQVPVKQG